MFWMVSRVLLHPCLKTPAAERQMVGVVAGSKVCAQMCLSPHLEWRERSLIQAARSGSINPI